MVVFPCRCLILSQEQVDVVVQVLNAEYRQYPTERNHERLEQKSQVLQRLKTLLSSNSTPGVGNHHDVSSYLL